MKRACVLILQRNLPDVTNALGDSILRWNSDVADLYVVESGSDDDKLSKFKDNTFHADWNDARENGLRTGRGFNFGLSELDKTGKVYDYYFLMTGDACILEQNFVHEMVGILDENPKCGILSPMSRDNQQLNFWRQIVPHREVLIAHWMAPIICWAFRRDLVNGIGANTRRDYMEYIFDGENFRCYDADTEIIAKTYIHDYYFGLTSAVTVFEDNEITLTRNEERKTESDDVHKKLMFEEGMAWLKKKYGFDNKQQMRDATLNQFILFLERNLGKGISLLNPDPHCGRAPGFGRILSFNPSINTPGEWEALNEQVNRITREWYGDTIFVPELNKDVPYWECSPRVGLKPIF